MPTNYYEECIYDDHDPTSPECLVAKTQIEESCAWKKAAKIKAVASVIVAICAIISTIAIIVAAVSVSNWAAKHHDNFYILHQHDWEKVNLSEM